MTLNTKDPVSVEGRWNTASAPGDIIIAGSGRWMHMTAASLSANVSETLDAD
jgi:hypothetical protein